MNSAVLSAGASGAAVRATGPSDWNAAPINSTNRTIAKTMANGTERIMTTPLSVGQSPGSAVGGLTFGEGDVEVLRGG